MADVVAQESWSKCGEECDRQGHSEPGSLAWDQISRNPGQESNRFAEGSTGNLCFTFTHRLGSWCAKEEGRRNAYSVHFNRTTTALINS